LRSTTHTHFTLHEVADGVFAAIHKEGGAAYSNAGIIDLGESVIVFDTFDMHPAAEELRAWVEHSIGKHVEFVINSHKHGDHWGGNQVFAEEALIISTHRTRDEMSPVLEKRTRLAEELAKAAERIREMESRLANETDAKKRTALERLILREKYTVEYLPGYKPCLPSQTFSGRIIFHGGKRSAELVSAGPAHTPEECYLVLPDEKIIFAGDLAFFDSPPFIAPDCDSPGWLEQLDAFIRSENELFVPGHGPLGDKNSLKIEMDYMHGARELVVQASAVGKKLEEMDGSSLLTQFGSWEQYAPRNENNLRTLYELHRDR